MNIRQIISPLSSMVSQTQLINWSKRPIIFPYYHTVSDEKLPYISNLYPLKSVDTFREELSYFKKHFTPLSIEQVVEFVRSNSRGQNPGFHLTFDDGLREIYTVIAPILEEMQIPATIFINTEFVDNVELFYRYKVGLILEKVYNEFNGEHFEIEQYLKQHNKWKNSIRDSLLKLNYHDVIHIDIIALFISIDFDLWLEENQPYLTKGEIKDLMKRGFAIGSHSADHPRFRNIMLDEQKVQVKQSFSYLKEHFDVDARYFSFPFGDEEVSKTMFDWMTSEVECLLTFGVSGIKDDYSATHIHRIPMDNCQKNPDRFIKSEYLYFLLKKVFNKNQIIRN